jgi:hypothetical protein
MILRPPARLRLGNLVFLVNSPQDTQVSVCSDSLTESHPLAHRLRRFFHWRQGASYDSQLSVPSGGQNDDVENVRRELRASWWTIHHPLEEVGISGSTRAVRNDTGTRWLPGTQRRSYARGQRVPGAELLAAPLRPFSRCARGVLGEGQPPCRPGVGLTSRRAPRVSRRRLIHPLTGEPRSSAWSPMRRGTLRAAAALGACTPRANESRSAGRRSAGIDRLRARSDELRGELAIG